MSKISSSFNWKQLWHTCARLVTVSAACRAACHLLHTMLARGLVYYQAIAEHVSAMVTSVDMSSPAVICESSLALMTHLLNVRNMEVPGGSLAACQNIVRWVFTKWNPCEEHHNPLKNDTDSK